MKLKVPPSPLLQQFEKASRRPPPQSAPSLSTNSIGRRPSHPPAPPPPSASPSSSASSDLPQQLTNTLRMASDTSSSSPTKKKPPLPQLIRRRGSIEAIDHPSNASSSSTSNASRSSSSSTKHRKAMAAVGEQQAGGSPLRKPFIHNSRPKAMEQPAPVVAVTVDKFEELLKAGAKVKASAKKRKTELSNALAIMAAPTSGGVDALIEEILSRSEEPTHLLALLLRSYLSLPPKMHSIALNARFLDRVRLLFSHPNNAYPPLAMELVEMTVDVFGDSIRHGLMANQHYIGTDVAAEQRFDRCTKCRHALMQLRLNSSFLSERMNAQQVGQFERLMKRIDAILEG